MNTIDIVMIAWPRTMDRLEYMRQSLESIRKHVTASGHQIMLYVSAESIDVTPERFQKCRQICSQHDAVLHWRGKSPSLGGNMNDALMLGYGHFKLLTQDDWTWNRPIDLAGDCYALVNPEWALVRYATFYTEFEGDRHFARADFSTHELKAVKMDGPYPYGDQPHLRRGDFAVKRSPKNGKPIGFYYDPGPESGPENYSEPENRMSVHLMDEGWGVLAHHPNVCDHNGSLSTDPERHPQPVILD